MNPTAIYSKSGKGVQEASGKTNLLKRPDRAVVSAIDGRLTLADVAQKVGRSFDAGFQQLIVQLDKDGFVREVSAGSAPAAKPGAPGKPAAKAPAKPAATEPMDAASDLDFSALGAARPASPPPAARPAPAAPKPPPAAPRPDAGAEARAKEQQAALNKAREEAEAKAQAERDRIKAETEAKMRAELEAKARADAEDKIKAEAESRVKGDAEAEAKVKAAREAAVRAAAEAKAKADAERKAREETERRLEQERKAREEAERKAREEAERARKQLEEERRKLEEERKREEQERAARRKREEEEEQARRKKREEEEQRAEAERAARRKQREEEEERQAEEERAARRKQREQEIETEKEQGEEAAAEKPQKKPKVEAKPEPKAAGGLDSLLADLDSFTQRDEDERKASEEAERKAKAEAERRAREDAERQEREASELKAKESTRSRKEDEKRRRKEEEERLAREQEKEQARLREEEERRKREADERARKAKEDEALTRQATVGATAPVGEGTDEVRRRMVGKRAPAPAKTEHFEAPSRRGRPGSWGRPVAITLIVLLAAAIGVAHVMPISTEDYERAASEALGRPVKIGSARLSLMTGLQLRFKDVKIGDGMTIASVVGSPELAALRGEKKIFSRIDLEGVKLPQEALGEALFARVQGDNFAVGRIVVKQLELDGPAPLPKPLEADLVFASDGKLRSATVRGPDTLLARLAPKDSSIEFEMTASGFPLPVVPEVTLSDFGMKGTASQRGMSIGEWGGKLFGGTISGTANVRWGRTWNVEGLITARNINAAVFAPALLSEGKAEGSGKFSMSGAEPSKLANAGRIEGSFTVSMGVLGSFDLPRAIQTSGRTVNGRTQFAEMNGQGVYDRGAVALRNVTIGAGALNAGASADIAQSGALSGRIVADMRTASQTLRATLNLGGTVREPQVRN